MPEFGEHKFELSGSESSENTVVLIGHHAAVHDCCFSPNGKQFATACEDGEIKIWDSETEDPIRTCIGHTSSVRSCEFTPDCRQLVSASRDGTIRLWDVATGSELAVMRGHAGDAIACCLSPDGSQIFSGGGSENVGELILWDLQTQETIRRFEGHQMWVSDCAFASHGQYLISVSYDNTMRVWNPTSGEQVAVSSGGEVPMLSCTLSPNGQHMATTSENRYINFWDSSCGKRIAVIEEDRGPVQRGVFSPDGRYFATQSFAGFSIWDIATSERVYRENLSEFYGITYAWRPDGKVILAKAMQAGWLVSIRPNKLSLGPPILTPWSFSGRYAFGCPHCGTWSEIDVAAIRAGARCDNCRIPVKLNPFTIDGDWREVAKGSCEVQ